MDLLIEAAVGAASAIIAAMCNFLLAHTHTHTPMHTEVATAVNKKVAGLLQPSHCCDRSSLMDMWYYTGKIFLLLYAQTER